MDKPRPVTPLKRHGTEPVIDAFSKDYPPEQQVADAVRKFTYGTMMDVSAEINRIKIRLITIGFKPNRPEHLLAQALWVWAHEARRWNSESVNPIRDQEIISGLEAAMISTDNPMDT